MIFAAPGFWNVIKSRRQPPAQVVICCAKGMVMGKISYFLAALAIAIVYSIASSAAEMGRAILKDASGKIVGEVGLRAIPSGVLLHAKFRGMAPGIHAFHVHAVGKCVPPFKSAGGHYNPDKSKHGLFVKGGPHAGDMPNVHVPTSGIFEIEVFNPGLKLDKHLFDSDGAAIVLHAMGDDYRSQPSGAAGARIACGVITR